MGGNALHKKQFQHWLDALSLVRPDRENHEKMTGYFFGVFAKEPEMFLEFLRYFKKSLQKRSKERMAQLLAEQYLHILSPLAERFGIFSEKREIDTLCFKIMHSFEYKLVESYLKEYSKESSNTIERITESLESSLAEASLKYEIMGRYKEPYSIYRKMQKKGLDMPVAFSDIFAFRIILESNDPDECFEVMNLLHDAYSPLTSRFKDYINIPKLNGYQSIHTCLNHVLPDLDLPIEIQIRTRVMHAFASEGLASHWLYARTKRSLRVTREEQRVLDHIHALSEESERQQLVYVFSKDGDVFLLPKGSTVLDFAYHLHTDLGERAKEAKINNNLKPLNYTLNDLEKVDIVTSEKVQLSDKRIDYVFNTSSRRKIYATRARSQ